MSGRHSSYERLRRMYPGGSAGARPRRYARMWARVFGWGLLPRRWVTLEVSGRRWGRVTRFPLGMADWISQWYLVPMLGERCNWARTCEPRTGVPPCAAAVPSPAIWLSSH